MKWMQVIDPLDNIWLSALVASLPVIFIFVALLRKWKGHVSSIATLCFSMAIAIGVYQMPVNQTAGAAMQGMMYGLFPICWIILGPVFLFNATVRSGQFEIIRNFMASITPDRRLQALLIAFSFGAFLEGSAGFGAPVAISAAMLIGLGFNPLYAAGLCLIANTAPVAFGSVGTPIFVAARVSEIPEMAISQMVGRTLPFLSFIIPFYLVTIMAGLKRSLEIWPAVLVSGFSFAFFQWISANYIGPMLPDILAGIFSIVALMILLRFWKPVSLWRFQEEANQTIDTELRHTVYEVLRAWSPFIIMTFFILAWGLEPVKGLLNSIGMITIKIPSLHETISRPDGSLLAIKPFELNYLSSPGTAVLFASLISVPLMRIGYREVAIIYWQTLVQLRYSFLTIACIVGFAFVANYSGMSLTMATAIAATGILFPFFSPVLGWLGVVVTGSDTSSNALFCKLQATSAEAVGIDPVVTVSANVSGGVTGKMISPQCIAIGAAAANLVGKESDLFRFTIRHSFIMLLIIGVLTMLQAYVIEWIIPTYDRSATIVSGAITDHSTGIIYLSVLFVTLSILVGSLLFLNRRRR